MSEQRGADGKLIAVKACAKCGNAPRYETFDDAQRMVPMFVIQCDACRTIVTHVSPEAAARVWNEEQTHGDR